VDHLPPDACRAFPNLTSSAELLKFCLDVGPNAL
jgi:hypothetical protein